MLCMMAAHPKGAMIAVAMLSGFTSGALIGLPPVCLAMLTKDKSRLGTRMGMGYSIIGLGVLTSGPSSGAILVGRVETLDQIWNSMRGVGLSLFPAPDNASSAPGYNLGVIWCAGLLLFVLKEEIGIAPL